MRHHPMRYVRSAVVLLILAAAGYLAVALLVYVIASLARWLT